SRTSGSSCATTGSPTASSNPTTISSTIVVRHGTSSSTSLGASCPSDCANGPTGSDQWDLVLDDQRHALRKAQLPFYTRHRAGREHLSRVSGHGGEPFISGQDGSRVHRAR